VGKAQNPEIHVRFGLGTGTLPGIYQADNGWLYTSNTVIGNPHLTSLTLPYQGCTTFAKAIEDAGLKNFVDGLRSVTMYRYFNQIRSK
jgi:hypothetical protein